MTRALISLVQHFKGHKGVLRYDAGLASPDAPHRQRAIGQLAQNVKLLAAIADNVPKTESDQDNNTYEDDTHSSIDHETNRGSLSGTVAVLRSMAASAPEF